MRRLVTLLTLVTLAVCGCSHGVVVPREELDSAEYRKPGSYRVRLHGWNEYYARRFSVTDSTVVIEELLKSDDRYNLMRHAMPIVIPAKDVASISVMETNYGVTAAVLIPSALVIFAFAYMITHPINID